MKIKKTCTNKNVGCTNDGANASKVKDCISNEYAVDIFEEQISSQLLIFVLTFGIVRYYLVFPKSVADI